MKKILYALSIAACVAMGLTACNNGSGGGSSSGVTATAVGNCQSGYVYTSQYGCLPQCANQPGYGNYNGQCIPGSVSNCGVNNTYPYGSTYPYNNGYNTGYNGTCNTGINGYNNGYNGLYNPYATGGGYNYYGTTYPTTYTSGGIWISGGVAYYGANYACMPGYSYYNRWCFDAYRQHPYFVGY